MPTFFSKRYGLFRNQAVRRELNSLDPFHDHQRMVHLLTAYEFPFDITRSLEFALLHTFASPRVSKLLAYTGEFESHGQKRYDDTSRLISEFMESGYDSEKGHRAIDQMNLIHSHYKIDNIDYLFVLTTFVIYPIDWIQQYGWRRLTVSEEQAFFYFFLEVGRRMNLQNVPGSLYDLRVMKTAYEEQYVRFADSNRKMADSTLRIIQEWFPRYFHQLVKAVFTSLMSERIRVAFGYQRPQRWLVYSINTIFWLRKWPLRWLTSEPYPTLIAKSRFRSYPDGTPDIESIGPKGMF